MTAHRIIFVVSTALLVCVPAIKGHGRDSRQQLASELTYQRVLDRVFPRQSSRQINFQLTLRFHPTGIPESQIVMTRTLDSVEVVEFKAPEDIRDALGRFLDLGAKEDADQMARLLTVKRRSVHVEYPQVKAWLGGLFKSFDETHDVIRREYERFDEDHMTVLRLHGADYDVWYDQSSRTFSMSFTDENTQDVSTGHLPIVRWMNDIRLTVERTR